MLQVGQDTEYFFYDTKEKRAIPAHTLGVPKEKVDIGWQGAYFRDGYALELNAPPSCCRAGLWEKQHNVLKEIKSRVIKGQENITLITDPFVPIDLKDILEGPPDVRSFGCSPTLDPYIKGEKEFQHDPRETPFRTIGAHLHISHTDLNTFTMDQYGILAKVCDLLIGLPFSVIFHDDLEFQRRELYGQAGEFRKQSYSKASDGYYGSKHTVAGFEYRVLSPRLYHHPGVFGLFSGIWKIAFGGNLKKLANLTWNDKLDKPLQEAINKGKGGVELLEEFSTVLKAHFDPKLEEVDNSGGSDFAYLPKDWAAAILALKKKADKKVFDKAHIFEHKSAHYGWYEYNTGKTRWSTVGATAPEEEKPWLL